MRKAFFITARRSLPALIVLGYCCASARAAEADDLTAQRSKLHKSFAATLEKLAVWCDENRLATQATQTRRWAIEREPGKTYVFLLQESAGFPEIPDDAPAALAKWRDDFVAARRAQAAALFRLAQKAATARRLSLAYELVMEGAREDPLNKKLRPLLGYKLHKGRWVTSYAAKSLDRGKVDHEKFGWILAARAKRYEAGERYLGRRWRKADDAAKIMQGDVEKGWTIETEHYKITTNSRWEEGVRLGRKLERLHAIWRQVFIGYYAEPSEIEALVRGNKPIRRRPRKHNVVCFRTRKQYNDFLRSVQPRIGITLGIYFDARKTAYFFAGEDQDEGTLYHEATHQLFQEMRPVPKRIGERNNFWIVEGIACYMESLTPRGGYFTLGGLKEGRVPAARVRLLEDGFYVPLAELVTFGRKDLQHDKRIAKLYSQSSGLATFLMHHAGGRYRDATVSYLERLYTNRADVNTLSKETGVSYDELDRQYRAFLQGQGEE
ncbi:MAG: hypothetical protein IID44_12380 [Planctomycetes bacterium]|nr:hypothetical protein [Planctomycetota bacterium]